MSCWLGGRTTAGKCPDCFGSDKDWVVATGGLDWKFNYKNLNKCCIRLVTIAFERGSYLKCESFPDPSKKLRMYI